MTLTTASRDVPETAAVGPWWRRLPSTQVIVWVWMVAMAAVRAGTTQERDPYWEARAGVENLMGTPLVRPDSWSWAPVHDLFYPNSPGWNLLLGVSWLAGGYWGLFLFTFAVLLAYFAIAYALARRLGAHPLAALAGVTTAFILALPMLSARGTVGVQLLIWIGLYIPIWWRPRLARTSPWLTGVVLLGTGGVLSVVGNWVHLSFVVMALVLAAAWALYWLLSDWPTGSLRDRLTDPRRWAAVIGGSLGLVGGILATPYGIAMTLERTRVTQAACAGQIMEWVSPFTTGLTALWPFVAICMIAILGGIGWWLVARLRSGQLDNTFALAAAICLVGVPFGIAGLFALRFLGVSSLTLVPVIGLGISQAAYKARDWAARLPSTTAWRESAVRWTTTKSWRIVLTVVAGILLPFAVVLGPGTHAVPAELEAIESLPSGCRLFTTASVAGPTILARPDVPIWFDGRADYFGRQRLIEAHEYFVGVGETSAPPGATCAIFPTLGDRDDYPAVTARLNGDPTWVFSGTYHGFDVWLRRG